MTNFHFKFLVAGLIACISGTYETISINDNILSSVVFMMASFKIWRWKEKYRLELLKPNVSITMSSKNTH